MVIIELEYSAASAISSGEDVTGKDTGCIVGALSFCLVCWRWPFAVDVEFGLSELNIFSVRRGKLLSQPLLSAFAIDVSGGLKKEAWL